MNDQLWEIIKGLTLDVKKRNGVWAVLFIALAVFMSVSWYKDKESCMLENKALREANAELKTQLAIEKIQRANLEHVLVK